MKAFLNTILRRNIYFLFIAAVLFIAAYVVTFYLGSDTTARMLSDNIEEYLQQREADFVRLSKDTNQLGIIFRREYNRAELIALVNRPYAFFIYQKTSAGHDSLAFWNDQRSSPSPQLLTGTDYNQLVYLPNGQFEVIERHIQAEGFGDATLLALIPVRWQYYITIDNLPAEFVHFPTAESRVGISILRTEFPIKSSLGRTLFYLEKKPGYKPSHNNWLTFLLSLSAIVMLMFVLHNMANTISERAGRYWGITFLVSLLLLLRLLTYFFPEILNLRQFELFDPTIYSSSFVLSSLGDLLINGILFCWLVLYLRQQLRGYKFPLTAPIWIRWIVLALVLSVIVKATFVFANIVQSLVTDAKISFNVTNFFSLLEKDNHYAVYSFLGFIVLAVLALSYFFLTQVLMRLISAVVDSINSLVPYIIMCFFGLLGLTFSKQADMVQLDILSLGWLLVYFWLMQRKFFSGLNTRINVSEVLFWLFVFSASIATVIIFENRKIEIDQRNRFAERLSELADPSSERLLNMSMTYFDNNLLYSTFGRFRDSSVNRQIKDSLTNSNSGAFLNKYDMKIYTYGADQKQLWNEDTVSFDIMNTIFEMQGKPTSIVDLRYYDKSYDKFTYISKKIITNPLNIPVGYLFILSEPKRYKTDGLIPELFQQKKEFLPAYSTSYYYAIYSNNELIQYYNDYAFPTHLSPSQIPKIDYDERKNGAFDELWHRVSDDKVVVVVKKDDSLIEAITLFSYLFTAFLVLVAISRIAAMLIRTRMHFGEMKRYLQLNIRSQIHTTIIFISLFSFVVIGIATIIFFFNRYSRNNQERLSKSMQIVMGEFVDRLGNNPFSTDSTGAARLVGKEDLEPIISRVAEMHRTDINLYNLNGDLVVSSDPFVYDKGILSHKMHPIAYFNMSRLQTVEYFSYEQMGKVPYLSLYCPLRNKFGLAYAYMNIPSFSTQDELKQEIANFLVTIINLNAFIFLIAGTIALFLTNRITNSLTLISEKMRAINLGKTNEVIEWKRSDEIGGLVKEYNKMVMQLEESAAALAKSEREGAWREMARQVAHEIKNPLTPMKLSIQYLQKAIDNNSPNVKEMTANVANTLVEQIDHLAKIAADFSQFANIDNTRNEIFDLHEMMYSLTSLYETTEKLLFKWVPVHQRVIVYADKTHLNRLFTNLLQNAIEACDEAEHRVVSVSEELLEDHIIVKVSDNGSGIPPQMRSKIFTPNFTTKSSGTGLGLAMSKSIVEQARGRIWFDTKVGVGTTFYVELPILSATT